MAGARARTAAAAEFAADGSLSLHFNFRAPPTTPEVSELQDQIRRAQMILCDATDEQIKLNQVRMTVGAAARESADVVMVATLGRSYALGLERVVLLPEVIMPKRLAAHCVVVRGHGKAHQAMGRPHEEAA
jgi:hypothetical protein